MLQRAASSAYSWWWASNIRTKQSKWLVTDLEEMEERVKSMLKIVEEDGDSFAKKAEMYFKKRPELVHFVEETYKAYKALADRYDHISSELHKANHTIATAFPDQIQYDIQDEENDNLPKAITSIDASKIRKPSADIPQISLMSRRKENPTALKKSRLARVASQNSKDKAQEEIDKLQKGILVLQTEKEYIKSSYESGIAKYWDIEKQITEMQEEVFFLQDEFSASVVIEDDEARSLMAVTALKSCEDNIVKLEEQQKQAMEEARIESERIKTAKEKIKVSKGTSSQPEEVTEVSNESRELISTTINSEEDILSQNEESLNSESLCDIAKEHIEISSGTSVVELAEKINELVTRAISLELTASSQIAQIKNLRSEADILLRHLQSFEEEKRTLIDDSNSLRDRLKHAEEKLLRAQDLEQHVQDKRSMVDKNSNVARHSLNDFSVEVMPPKHQDQVNIAGLSQEVTSLHNTEAASVCEKELKETLELDQDEKCKFDKSSIYSSFSHGDISEKLMSPKHWDQINFAGPSQEGVICLQNEKAPREGNKEVKETLDTVKNLVEESQGIQELGPCLIDQENFDHSESGSQLKDDSDKSHVGKQVVEISSLQTVDNVHPKKESKSQLKSFFDYSEAGFLLKNNSAKSQAPKQEVEISSSPADDSIHQSMESKQQHERSFDHLKADSQLKDDSVECQVAKQEVEISSSPTDDSIHQSKESKPQHEKSFDHLEADSQLKDDSVEWPIAKQEVEICSSQGDDNILQNKESKTQPEDQELSLNWLQSLVDGLEGKEKIILAEYTSVLRSYKDTKKRLSEVEKKNQEYLLETAMQIRELKSANAVKDEEIHSLWKYLRSVQSNFNHNADVHLLEQGSKVPKPEVSQNLRLKATTKRFASFDVSDRNPFAYKDIKLPATDGRHTTSVIEEKFRRDIDTVLEENLEFWLRFSTSFHNIQKFQTAFEELQDESKKLKHRKLGEGSSQSPAGKATNLESLPIDKKLRELKTELQVWVEQNMLLQGELESKFSSLSSIQEEISGTLEASLEASLEADVVKFAPYQAAKFQGELMNIQLENNKVAEELKAGLDHISGLQAEVEKTLSRLHKKFELPESGSGNHESLRHLPTKNRVPLKSFLFSAKPKKKQSFFSSVSPALHKHMATGRPS